MALLMRCHAVSPTDYVYSPPRLAPVYEGRCQYSQVDVISAWDLVLPEYSS